MESDNIESTTRKGGAQGQRNLHRDALSTTRGALLDILKTHGPSSAAGVARRLHISREASRQQLALLERAGWVSRQSRVRGRGRPQIVFVLTEAGDGLFPKHYAALTVTLIDTVAEEFGSEALKRLLTALTDQQVKRQARRLRGKSLEERLEALKGLYSDGDPFISVRKDQRGFTLVERNCPYLSIAMRRPQLCSVSLSALTRLLGVRVVRERRFQDGDGCCVFRILEDQPAEADLRFAYEECVGDGRQPDEEVGHASGRRGGIGSPRSR